MVVENGSNRRKLDAKTRGEGKAVDDDSVGNVCSSSAKR